MARLGRCVRFTELGSFSIVPAGQESEDVLGLYRMDLGADAADQPEKELSFCWGGKPGKRKLMRQAGSRNDRHSCVGQGNRDVL